MSEIDQLRADIRADRATYYAGTPVISDELFDAKVDRLRELSPNDEVLAEVGADPVDTKRKRALEVEMRSMEKVKLLAEIARWLAKYGLPEDTLLIGMPKYDGISQSQNESTKAASTRGNGVVGSECDRHIRLVRGFDPTPRALHSLGEVIMRRDKFEKYAAEGDANARNTVGGLLGNDEATEELRDCDLIRYGMVSTDHVFDTKEEQLRYLNSWQLIQVPYVLIPANELTEDYLKNLYMQWSVDYTLDGLILEVNDLALQKKLGRERSGNPAYARAYKGNFEEQKPSSVTGLTWKTSKYGKVVPTIQIVPVSLDGAMVTNITGNNARYIKDMGIVTGVGVTVKRSGGVIPQLVHVDDPSFSVPLPTHCGCGHELNWDENQVQLVCKGLECPSQALMRIVAFFAILEVDGVSEGVLTQLYNHGFDTIAKVLAARPSDFLPVEGFAERKAVLTYQAIAAKLTDIPLPKLQHATGLFRPLGSKKLALLQHFTEKPTLEEVCAVPGFSTITATAYLGGWDEFYAFVQDLPLTYKAEIKAVVTEGHLLGTSFVFTGVRRQDLEKAIEAAGGAVGSGVSAKTTHLVVKDKGSSSTKTQKATKLGIPILDEAEAEALILGV